jgi:hypothetical protein
LNDAHFGDLRWSVRSVRGDDEIRTGAAQPYQFPQGFDASSRTGSSNRPKAEPLDDPRNDLSILVLADQNVRQRTAIRQGHHELTGMPKRDDDMLAVPVQAVHMFVAACFDPHRPSQGPNHRRSGRRKHRKLDPAFHRFQP